MAFNHYAKKLDIWYEETKFLSVNDMVEGDILTDFNAFEPRFAEKICANRG